MEAVKAERVAVVCVHGVAPHPRYEFQDQVAGDLCARLNERAGSAVWELAVINPSNVLEAGTDDPLPTITRVRHSGDDVALPAQTSYDVTEAYWSPIDKGTTNWFWVVQWLFRTAFAPFNTVARIQAPFAKQFFDYGFIGGALLLTFALFALSLFAVWRSLNNILTITGLFRGASVGEAMTVLNSTAVAPGGQRVAVVLWLFVGIVGAFLVGQAFSAILKTWQQRLALLRHPESIWHRALAIGILTIVGALFIYGMAVARFAHGSMGWTGVGFLILIFLAFQIGRALLVDFIVGFFGDVQIYTTRDENDSKFYGLRDQIMDTAVTAIMRAVSPRSNGGHRYDRVVVIAHSLGATIATDALTRLKQACEQGALAAQEFGRIRAFIMLGSSLEKTDYFFDVSGAAPSVSYEAWRGDAYERVFDDDPGLIADAAGQKIFWANYWYFQDPICNEIRSYGDFCRNEEGSRHLTLVHPMLHSDYLDDPWFWFSSGKDHLGALDIITGVS
ncbi:MAG TPA: hypothetical protein VNF68_07540 [Candidatus Baltobacteraceae bacterium]|nr:hypothetical protein [Candidatus Baltobacteraceae bacterium]